MSKEMMSDEIPIVDFAALSLAVKDEDISDEELTHISEKLIHIFSITGFVYLSSTGIPHDVINKAFQSSKQFFSLPVSAKKSDLLKAGIIFGWTAPGQEAFEPGKPGDLKEAFDFCHEPETGGFEWPREVPNMKMDLKKTYSQLSQLGQRVMLAIAVGLKLDRDFVERCHHFEESPEPYITTGMRTIYYPSISDDVTAEHVRLGEHTDYGTITLLLQDHIGGLEVKGRNGNWIEARPITDTVIVNIADLMQRWTSDKLVSTPHRIRVPESKKKRSRERQSIVFFAHPDAQTQVTCLDGSNKYPETNSGEYLLQRLRETYLF